MPLPQLLSPRVSTLAEILEKADSCYWPALQAMFRDVSAGRAPGGRGLLPLASPARFPGRPRCFSPAPGLQEANNISLYLQPLQTLLEEMEQAEYVQVGYTWWHYRALPALALRAEPRRLCAGAGRDAAGFCQPIVSSRPAR